MITDIYRFMHFWLNIEQGYCGKRTDVIDSPFQLLLVIYVVAVSRNIVMTILFFLFLMGL
jgi:hypothetical protein